MKWDGMKWDKIYQVSLRMGRNGALCSKIITGKMKWTGGDCLLDEFLEREQDGTG